jgi:hypothetical protein
VTQPPPDTPPDPDAPDPDAGGGPIKLSEIIEEWMTYGNTVIDRLQARATTNAKAVEDRTYGRHDLLSDVAWFWDQAATDAKAAAEYLRDKFGAT